MSQNDPGTIPGATSGNGLAALIRNWRDALHTTHSGASRPSYVQPGMMWLDNSSSTAWVVKLWTGTMDASIARITPSTGEVDVFTKSEADNRYARLDGGNVGSLGGFRNKLINPRFAINQRVFTAGTAAANTFVRDRWRAGAAGCSFTVAGETMTITAGSVFQIIDGAEIEATESHTFGHDGTAPITVNGTAVTNGNSVSLPAGANARVEFGTGTVIRPQVERGTRRTAFERRAALEMSFCQAFYQKSYADEVAPGASNAPGILTHFGQLAGSITGRVLWPGGRMRASPSMGQWRLDGTGGATTISGGGTSTNVVATLTPDLKGFAIGVPNSDAAVRFHWSADAEIAP